MDLTQHRYYVTLSEVWNVVVEVIGKDEKDATLRAIKFDQDRKKGLPRVYSHTLGKVDVEQASQ